MSILQDKAMLAATSLHENHGVEKAVAINPAIILVIVQALKLAIEFYLQYCKKNATEALASAKNLGIFEKWTLRQLVRKAFGGNNALYRRYYREVEAAIAELPTNINDDEVVTMFMEVEDFDLI